MICPPKWSDFSNKVTVCPLTAATLAASNPAIPPPITTTFWGLFVGLIETVASFPFSAFKTHEMYCLFWIASTHPLLQFKHSLMHSPFFAFKAISGSVNKERP